jgi:hypothetical protein
VPPPISTRGVRLFDLPCKSTGFDRAAEFVHPTRFAVGGAEAAQRPLTEAGVLAPLSGFGADAGGNAHPQG